MILKKTDSGSCFKDMKEIQAVENLCMASVYIKRLKSKSSLRIIFSILHIIFLVSSVYLNINFPMSSVLVSHY